MNKKILTILLHFFGWIAFFLFPFLLLEVSNPNELTHLKDVHYQGDVMPAPGFPFYLSSNSLLILFFYLNLFLLLPGFYYKQKKLPYFLIVFVIILLVIYVPSFCTAGYMPPKIDISTPARPIAVPGFERLFGFFQVIIIWFLSSLLHLTHRYKLIEQENKEITFQKLHAELSYLKAQINPHFLFNTLNNIYALSIIQNDQTPEAILKLSSIMRYVTEDADKATVPLQKELDYLENYISLQQLRSNDKLTVVFAVTGAAGDNFIAPLLLINFIENAFKYGISNHEPGVINISIAICATQLTLQVRNKIMVKRMEQSTFTGTSNTLKRLQLQYAKKHVLTIDNKGDLYTVFLQLDLA